jgi:tRNA threonylcarbamoyladenosine biosynthesis protein TsaB
VSTILAIECSTLQAGVALYRDDQPLAKQVWTRQTTHGEHLTPSVELLFKLAHLKISDIDLIAVGIGPGSFTGVRIAVNTAKSIAFAIQKPMLAFSTLHILAESQSTTASDGTQIIATMDALNGNFYAGSYAQTSELLIEKIAPVMFDPVQLAQFVSDREGEGPTVVIAKDSLPKVECLAALAIKASQHPSSPSSTLNWNQVAPLYIRASSAEEKMRKTNERDKNISSK